jgi:hypothetical protein
MPAIGLAFLFQSLLVGWQRKPDLEVRRGFTKQDGESPGQKLRTAGLED